MLPRAAVLDSTESCVLSFDRPNQAQSAERASLPARKLDVVLCTRRPTFLSLLLFVVGELLQLVVVIRCVFQAAAGRCTNAKKQRLDLCTRRMQCARKTPTTPVCFNEKLEETMVAMENGRPLALVEGSDPGDTKPGPASTIVSGTV